MMCTDTCVSNMFLSRMFNICNVYNRYYYECKKGCRENMQLLQLKHFLFTLQLFHLRISNEHILVQ